LLAKRSSGSSGDVTWTGREGQAEHEEVPWVAPPGAHFHEDEEVAMDERRPDTGSPRQHEPAMTRPYEPPRIIWREPYEPVSFGVSCALVSGFPPCGILPIT